MANFESIAAAGRSIERLLNHWFDEAEPVPDRTTTAVLVRTEDLEDGAASSLIVAPAVSIFAYRIDFNRTMRAAWSAVGAQHGRAHLPLDMHFLLTPWAENADYELRILGRAMECLETHPILTGPLLDPLAGWTPNEAVQVVLGEISTEEVMRTFDSLPVDYKLSVPYVARIVRIDGQEAHPDVPVMTLVSGAKPSPEP